MKIWMAATAALSLAACSQPSTEQAPEPPAAIAVEAPSGAYTLDPHHSTVTVRALHFGLAHYTLRFNALSGALNFNAEAPEQSTVEVTVAMNSLDTPYAGERDFDAELQNSEWLDAAGHPTATFRSTSVERTGPNAARISGDLTLRGVTRPVTFDATYNGSWAQHPAGVPISGIGFSARGTIRRSEFGVMALQPTTGPASGVADEVELLIEAEFNRPVENAPVPSAPTAEPVD